MLSKHQPFSSDQNFDLDPVDLDFSGMYYSFNTEKGGGR